MEAAAACRLTLPTPNVPAARQAAAAPAAPTTRAVAAGPQRLKPGFTDLGSGAGVHYLPGALAKRSKALMAALQTEAEWQEREVVMFGRRVLQPRKVGGHRVCDNCCVATAWLFEVASRLYSILHGTHAAQSVGSQSAACISASLMHAAQHGTQEIMSATQPAK